MLLLKEYPGSRVVGHRDLSPDLNHNGEIEPEEFIKGIIGKLDSKEKVLAEL